MLRDPLGVGIRPQRFAEILMRRLSGTILVGSLDLTTDLAVPFEDRFNLTRYWPGAPPGPGRSRAGERRE